MRPLLIVLLILLSACADIHINETLKEEPMKKLTFVPIGDSYTIGTGASAEESWPAVLSEQLRAEGWNVTLRNPAMNGWTTKQAIEYELPVLRHENATFSSLLIGANDIVQGVSAETYRKHVQVLLDELVKQTQGRAVVLTIPDFTRTRVGKQFGDSKPQIEAFNAVMKEEAEKRDLPIIDLYALKNMSASEDGLHPSAEEYARWAKLVKPVVLEKLS
ncbi:MAG: SGNH/GDSL hydrolase family protein [Nanoarchaeota archaeon]|nr:SGNH/GDSL hydrolase family protein [Nanoarchaeota archaeon]